MFHPIQTKMIQPCLSGTMLLPLGLAAQSDTHTLTWAKTELTPTSLKTHTTK